LTNNITTSPSHKGDCRSSRSHEGGRRSSPSSQGVPRHSKSTKSKLEKAPSDKAEVYTSNSEHEGCKQCSLRGYPSYEENLRHSTFLQGTSSHLLLLLPPQDPDIPLILKKPSKLPLQSKKASTHLQMLTVPMGVSHLLHHPKVMMSNTLILPRKTLDMLFLSKRDRKLPLMP
uniref:Uncharacterized protein n=1 Tax=Peromyscus maniculatus bairdii TaxID=230844 RepID=A0A8C8UJG5_PERMB